MLIIYTLKSTKVQGCAMILNMKIEVLYEDENFLAINKPAGISVHQTANNKEYSVADWIQKNYPELEGVGEDMYVEYKGEQIKINRPGIVHRLDKDTSGVLLIAKNQESFTYLKRQFKKHAIQKTYNAFVYGSLKDPVASLRTGKKGVINSPIGRSPKNIRMWTAGRGARGEAKDALTEYIVLKRFEEQGESFSYVEVYPKSGRTHQIRVHLRYINHPVVSDPLYANNNDQALGFLRTALHARMIYFKDRHGKDISIEAPFPQDFENAIVSQNLA